ncbi:nitrogen assimilation transcription factor nira [Colletotrichum karsti]|uniref:Nitrogen assimilation transcription factor nira n=1 Tax=Colletotrichum karsti TaxID=1095194 RepID=A0A9P6I0X6_9PEZI|nr:nitrogen assimilation transcription factor nira [Colletotrichum karsti]KAF9874234.1 nitrogen assimilation transcription factor nira [Colletotrichum karsti]
MLQSLFLGRSPEMQKVSGSVPREYLDSYEELEEWKPYYDPMTQPFEISLPVYQPRPSYALSTFTSLLRLCDIMGRVIKAFYSASSIQIGKEVLLKERETIRNMLVAWQDELPSWLRFRPGVDETPPPHQITPHAIFSTLVILTEQAFLNRGHFSFSLEQEAQNETRERCIQAALHIWQLVEAYKKAFTLRRAQYGISYASYCAVVVILQQTDHDSDEYIDCIRFFWRALLEYQKGCNYGLQKPLKLLKSLMRRLENVSQNINMDETETETWQGVGSFQAELDSILGSDMHTQGTINEWNGAAWDFAPNNGPLGYDTMFGVATDSIFGFCM